MTTRNGRSHPRRLQVFSLDPAADVRLDTAMISRCVLNVGWEDLTAGPIGDYVEVVDYDPASGCGYDPVDLDGLLATDGLSPSTGNPQFHQQMVYAVVMHTIKNFERVLFVPGTTVAIADVNDVRVYVLGPPKNDFFLKKGSSGLSVLW